MEEIRKSPVFQYNPNQMAEVRKAFNYEDVNKLKQDLDIFQDWIKKQNHFVVRDIDRDYLEKYLVANKGSVERAKKRFDRLCTLRNLLPDFLKNYDMRNEFRGMFKCTYMCILPKPTPDNYRVALTTMYSEHHEDTDLIDYYRYLFASIEYLLCYDYNCGYEFVADTRLISLSMATKMNPVVVHKALTVLEAYGLRLKAFHFISGSKAFDMILTLFKQGLSEKFRNRVFVHNSNESLRKQIPKEILPEEYGGDEKSLKELSDDCYKELSSDEHMARLKYVETITTDESRRLSCDFNEEYSGMPGSFKTMCVD